MANVTRIVTAEVYGIDEHMEVEDAQLGGRGLIAIQVRDTATGTSGVIHLELTYDDGKETRQAPVQVFLRAPEQTRLS